MMDITSLNVLFIGNSFSECTCAYLYDILTALRVPNFNIAALKISGCSLNTHWYNAQTDAPAYMFYRYTTSGDRETISSSSTLKEGILSFKWDWVIFADTAVGPANPAFYTKLRSMIGYVRALTVPGETKFAFNMTWPWESGYHKYSTMFDGSADIMFQSIASCVQRIVMTDPDITCILPNGTAIRNAILSGRAPSLYRDGSHLNANGCFIVSLTTAYTLLKYTNGATKYDISSYGLPCLPTTPHRTNGSFIGALEPEYADIFFEAASSAVTNPMGSTE